MPTKKNENLFVSQTEKINNNERKNFLQLFYIFSSKA